MYNLYGWLLSLVQVFKSLHTSYALCIKKALTNQGTKGRILVVDDDPDIITLTLKAELEIVWLFDVDMFNDPESALKSFKPDFHALVLIDITMPFG